LFGLLLFLSVWTKGYNLARETLLASSFMADEGAAGPVSRACAFPLLIWAASL
jgi:hypothetical protein